MLYHRWIGPCEGSHAGDVVLQVGWVDALLVEGVVAEPRGLWAGGEGDGAVRRPVPVSRHDLPRLQELLRPVRVVVRHVHYDLQ